MREIKFRAWDGERMYYPSVFEDGLESGHENMQFTGLRDKNGREIYEGDIIASPEGDVIGEVYFGENDFHPGNWAWCVEFRRHSNFLDKPSGWKVVGNIHENPELLNPPAR